MFIEHIGPLIYRSLRSELLDGGIFSQFRPKRPPPQARRIDERWFRSTTRADNGPLTAADEGLSYIDFNGKREQRAAIPRVPGGATNDSGF